MTKYLLFILFILLGFQLKAKESYPSIILNPEIEEVYVSGGLVGVFEDENNKLTINEVSKYPLQKFNWNHTLYNDKTNATYWIVFNVADLSSSSRKFILEILDSRHYETILYAPNPQGGFTASETGMKFPFKSRQYSHKNFVIDMPTIGNKEKKLYLKIHSKVLGALVFKIRTNREFSSYAFNEYYYLGIYYGILFIFALYNFLLFLSIKNSVYLYYVFYILSWGFYSMIDDGTGYQFIWSNYPIVSEIGYHIAQPLLMITFVFYSRSFFNITNRNKDKDYYILIATVVYILFHVFSKPFESPLIYHCLFLLPFLSIYYISIKVYKNNYFPARFFILGNTFIFLGYLLRFLKDRGLLDTILFEHDFLLLISIYSRNIALVLDIIVLSLALADLMRYIKNKEMKSSLDYISQLEINEKLKDKVNLELEERIKERTKVIEKTSTDLDSLNKKLQNQLAENEKMASVLDKNNYELIKEVKQTKKSRILSKNLNYEEFLEIFPTEISIESYIENLKLQLPFKCTKCGNSSYKSGDTKFSLQCKKCGFEEIVTANTIFYRSRFPLYKALYIIYTVANKREKFNSTTISNEIDLRRNTVSDFKNKTLTIIEALQKNKIEVTLNSIILNRDTENIL